MKKMRRLMGLSLHNERGAALIAVFLVLMVLLTLGLGVMALSMGSAKQAVVTDTYEKAYYVAQGGAQQGIEYIRNSIADIYKDIKADVVTFSTVDTIKNNADYFFDQLNTKVALFSPASPDLSVAAAVTGLDVVIPNGAVDDVATRTYTITSTGNGTGASRAINAKLTVHFVKVDMRSVSFRDEALITMGTFTQKSGANGMKITGDTLAANYNLKEHTITGTKKLLADYPEANTDALAWHIDYAKRLSENPMKTSGFTTTITSGGTVGGDVFSWKKPPDSSFPMRIKGTVNTTISSSMNDYLKGVTKYFQIDSTKNLTIESNVSGTASNYVKIYCDGNFTLTGGGILNYVELYCSGNVTLSQSCSNVKVSCAGDLTITGGANMTGTNMLYSGGNVSFYSTTINGTLVLYAEKSFGVFGSGNIGSSGNPVKGIIYTNGTFSPGSMSLHFEGQVVAKSAITLDNGTYSFKGNPALLASLEADPFVTSGTVKTVVMPPISTVVTTTQITEP